MAVWLIRAGSYGEHEQKFIDDKRVYVTWDALNVDLKKLTNRDDLINEMETRYVDAKQKTIQNWARQVWSFAYDINVGDLVVLPLKAQRAIRVGKIIGSYQFEPKGPSPYFHWRSVTWMPDPVPRSHFGGDLLNSFGAFLTICRISRNNAEERISAMQANGWQPETINSIVKSQLLPSEESATDILDIDPEEGALDQIAKLIEARFKGHNLTRLVEGILKAQGYTTYRSPEGSDGGADILAGTGPLGFGEPRLCVEVKSESSQIDRPTVDKLLGAVSKFGAQEGLFVSWSGYKSNVQKQLAPSFFKVRLWSDKELLEALFENYDRLDDELKAELPLKRIWAVSSHENK